MSLTAEQRAALDALPEKRRRFVLAYVGEAAGNQTAAARIAGYKAPEMEAGRLMGFDGVRRAVEAFRAPAEDETIASIEELRRLWTRIARGELADTTVTEGHELEVTASLATRMKATELLGKSQGAFVERREVEHKGTHVIGVLYPDVETATRVARAALSKSNGGESE